MAKLLIKNVRPFINGKIKPLADILIQDNKIAAISSKIDTDCPCFDGGGNIIAPGYIDIHTHGGYGHDIMEATDEAVRATSKFHLEQGTTAFCPTTLTASLADTISALDNLRAFKGGNDCARLLGAHLEGPYLSAKAAGAHPQHLLLDPNPQNSGFIWDNIDIISRITVAPNLEGAKYLTQACTSRNIQVSLGHDNSIDEEIYNALDCGASSVTHLYNCTSRPSRRTTPKKYLGLTEVAMIDSRIIAEVIADDRHVSNALFEMIFALKGAKGIALVSDSLSVAGMQAGDYFLGSGADKQIIRVQDGVATLPSENTYAGSVTPIAKMVQNLVQNTHISLSDCLTMAITTPCKLMNITSCGAIKKGCLADMNILDEKGFIVARIFDGRIV